MNLTKQARTIPALVEPAVDRLFERLFGMPEWPAERMLESTWTPAVDVAETATEYVMKLDAPGFHRENMEINLDGNVLTISGRRDFKKDEETLGYVWRERQEGKFVRSIRMPAAIDPSKVSAAYQEGILTVRVPKANPTVTTRVQIK